MGRREGGGGRKIRTREGGEGECEGEEREGEIKERER